MAMSPQNSTQPAATGTGLLGVYFNTVDLSGWASMSRVDPTIDFNWGLASPDARLIQPETFSVRWLGFVAPRFSEIYTFYTTADDGIRLWIDGLLIIDDFTDHSARERSGIPWRLTAGRQYSVKIDYYNNLRRGVAKLAWSSPSEPKQIISQRQLTPASYILPGV
jgi:hypothetical protein